jgi:Ca2+-binding RTX toxin-like protein
VDLEIPGRGFNWKFERTYRSGIIFDGLGNDEIQGEQGNDLLNDSDGNDYLSGGGGFDTLDGGPGNDELNGYIDRDNLFGGTENDIFGIRTYNYYREPILNFRSISLLVLTSTRY